MLHVSLVVEALHPAVQTANPTLNSQAAALRIAAYASQTTFLTSLRPHALNATSPAKLVQLQAHRRVLAATPTLSNLEAIHPLVSVSPASSLTLNPTIVQGVMPRAPPAQEAQIFFVQLAKPMQCYQAQVRIVANAQRHPFQIQHQLTASCVILPV